MKFLVNKNQFDTYLQELEEEYIKSPIREAIIEDKSFFIVIKQYGYENAELLNKLSQKDIYETQESELLFMDKESFEDSYLWRVKIPNRNADRIISSASNIIHKERITFPNRDYFIYIDEYKLENEGLVIAYIDDIKYQTHWMNTNISLIEKYTEYNLAQMPYNCYDLPNVTSKKKMIKVPCAQCERYGRCGSPNYDEDR